MLIPPQWNTNAAHQKTDTITTLEDFAAEITMSENLRNFLFEPVETTAGTEAKAACSVALNGYVAPGETITFQFVGFSIILTAAISPTSGEFWTQDPAPIPVNSTYTGKVIESLMDALNQILSVRNSYVVNYQGGSSFQVLAKEYGTQFNVSATSTTANFFINSGLGAPKYQSQSKIDYSAFAWLYVGKEIFASAVDKFAALEVDFYTIDSAQNAANMAFGVAGDFVQPVLPQKKLTPANDYYLMDNSTDRFVLRPYFVVYGDSWREVVNGQKKQFVKGVTPVRWVQLGALDHLRPYNMNEYVWIPNNPNTFKWLSSGPEKEVTYNSHEYLQLICKKPTTNNNFNLEIKCNFYDGTSIIVSKPTFSTQPLVGERIGGNISFDVSPLALGLLTIETANLKQIDSYQVKLKWIANGAAVGYSEIKSYKFQRDCNEKSHQIMFLNEFGAWDCIEFRGENQNEIDRSTSVINRVLPPNSNKADAVNYNLSLNIQTDTTENTTIHSGLLKKEVYDWAAKLFDSPAIYLWNEDLADYEAINVVEYDYGFDTKQGGGSISLTYNRTQNNTIAQ